MANWIWNKGPVIEDSYVEFTFDLLYEEKEVEMLIAAVNNYSLYLNGVFVDSSSYHSYPYAPTLDRLNIKLNKGLNKLNIIVYNSGVTSCMFFYKDIPGLYFSISDNGRIIKESDEKVLSALSKKYISNQKVYMTGQIGFKQFYDFTQGQPDYQNSIIVKKSTDFQLRPNRKCLLLGRINTTIVKKENDFIIVDTGKESVGFLDFNIDSESEQDVIVSFGEHIVDGKVRRLIHGRDFSYSIRLREGNNQFLSTLKRIGARYIQIDYSQPLKVNYLGLYKVEYPFVIKSRKFTDDLDQKIYDTAINTLKCCYHEHFEDCPWREQSLYTLDSRLQMLAYYQGFDNQEAISSSIDLMLNDWRKDGQLNICFPTDASLVIPSYSLYLFDIVWENYKYTHSIDLLKRSNSKLESILKSFVANMEDGLVNRFYKESYWNFYEWKKGYEGYTHVDSKNDSMINLLFLNCLMIKNEINNVLNISKDYSNDIKSLKQKIIKEFYNSERELIDFYKNGNMFSALINSLAVSLDVVPNKEITIHHILNDKDVVQPTLAMKYFLYDALLKTDKSFDRFILEDIRKTYKKMLDEGATSFFETELGEKDFDGAGSLCHGWSGAIPIYFYNTLSILKEK